MTFKDKTAIVVGKSISWISKTFGFGAGATWPGEAALKLSPHILAPLAKQFHHGVILVAGTNGKTTTSLMIKTILHYEELKVVSNNSGANLLNGLVSACIKAVSKGGRMNADWGVFEVDENSLPIVLRYVRPKVIVLLNLFRDQLDRYGEVDTIAEKWKSALSALTSETTLVLNADDPLVAFLGKDIKANTVYFGLTEKTEQGIGFEHATDSIFCLNCGSRLTYNANYFSHLGDWYCKVCGEKRPNLTLSSWESPLPGLYNKYNALASALTGQILGIHNNHMRESLKGFTPAFGRQEERVVNGSTIKLFLSKNPAGFNASLRAVLDMKPRVMILALNDRIPDGRDISWIWDVDFEMIAKGTYIIVTGDRVYDMAIRMKYAINKLKDGNIIHAIPNTKDAITHGLAQLKNKEILYTLSTYSAMLDIRKIITGRKIL
jgi:lipid II isoglutaminyl synthase (glutamine-hydrolysing)